MTVTMTITITSTDPYGADKDALAKLIGVPVAAAGTPVPTGPAPIDYWPGDPGLAPFPSPENSQIIAKTDAGGKVTVGGHPYLKDQEGAVHEIRLVGGAALYYKNGQNVPVYPGEAVGQCLMRQGEVFMSLTNGIWKHVDPNGSMYNRDLPPVSAPRGAEPGTPALPDLPALPTRSEVAPGSSGRVVICGTGQPLGTLSLGIAAALPGDTVKLAPGRYNEAPPAWSVPLEIDLGGATLDGTGLTAFLARGKGLLVPTADSFIHNGTITNVAADQTEGQLTCAIRPDQGCGYLKLAGLTINEGECAVGHGGFPVVIDIEDSDISNNGLKHNTGANTHNLYTGKDCISLSLKNVVSDGCYDGHAVKHRGPMFEAIGCTFAAENGSCIDLPNGTTKPFTVSNTKLIKRANDADHVLIRYGEEGPANGLAGGSINGGVINAGCPNPLIVGPGGTITVSRTTSELGNTLTTQGGIALT